ncbi:MAG TPA: sigma-70 family RNA polymerase sigma factor [Planctomycetota bacterium]|nr:sigma-70 family RNA polymerase sigma factor [Planctomycetota bacterium]
MSSDPSRFPYTRHSVLALVQSDDAGARQLGWDALVRAYWKPAYKYLRLRWRADRETASDWTQAFFARAIEKGTFERFDPAKARFRTFLRVCLDGFAANERESAGREKRGGRVLVASLDFERAEGELAGVEPPSPDTLDAYFHREWMRTLFELALEDLRAECERDGRAQDYAVFRRYDLDLEPGAESPSYAAIAAELGVSVTHVTNRLHATRARLRACVLARLRELCATDEEFRAEARAILGSESR